MKRVVYIDILNIISCIAVVMLHHNSQVWHFEQSNAWRLSLLIECALYWAVPVFLMISGANLLNYREKYSTEVFLKKRIVKTVFPWLAWSTIVLIWKIFSGQFVLEERSLSYMADLYLGYKIENVYWFFGALFACYLAIPVYSLLVNNRKILWYIVGLNFIFLSCLPFVKIFVNINWSLDVPVVGSLTIFILLGYLFATSEIGRKERYFIYLLGIGGFALRYIYTYIMSVRNDATDSSIKGYAMFHSVFLAVAVFVWVKNVKWDKYINAQCQRYLTVLSSCSFGVYLIHRIVIYYELHILHLNVNSMVWKIAMVPVTYAVSVVIVSVLKKIPFVKTIVP